ncbi:MAG: NADH dehydrogenase FAD-containing subunit [Acidobacteria bacterium]|nr:NADH dehydrogenase FAD-containing subunit [Acidobacteriota bacterium]
MLLAFVLLPAAAAAVSLLIRGHRLRRALLVSTAVVHAALVAWRAIDAGSFPAVGAAIALDAAGLLFLGVTSLLFLAVSTYAAGFLARETGATRTDVEEGFLFDNSPEALFTACLLAFLSAMSLVTLSAHLGVLWVAVEATTLLSAPLIHYHRHHRSLEATWKYLLVCSVGIAIALLGTYFLAAAGSVGGPASGSASGSAAGEGSPVGLTFPQLLTRARELDPRWLKAAFILLVVGYGTKMGLAPLHTWLPDAHSEAPSAVSALLSGALLNCAFLAVLRVHAICSAAGIGSFSRDVLLAFGLLSMAVAAVYVIGQPDFKRLLAYSSVENMGILAVGVGIGGLGDWGSLFHAVNHSLAKAALFLVAGNILAAYGTKRAAEVRGLAGRLPASGALWVAGFFAIAGAPPFGAFLSELAILRAAIEAGSWLLAAVYSILLLAVFVGMAAIVARMLGGAAASRQREPASQLAAPIALLAIAAGLGLYVPRFLDGALREAARLWGG